MNRVVVIGAGIGGLTAAAVLSRAGLEVTVLEAHIYPGGCAGTYYHKGFRFDAGATLAGGFYPGGPMDLVARAAGIPDWKAVPASPVMAVHLPERDPIRLWGGDERWVERRLAFGDSSEAFWKWQEAAADSLWELALHLPAWPPQTLPQLFGLLKTGLDWLGKDRNTRKNPGIFADAFRPVASHLRAAPDSLRQFVDAQLLISAQITSRSANALYGAAALDLSRRGVVHLEGGMGAIAQALTQAVRRHGGQVHFRQEASRVVFSGGQPAAVQTQKGETFPADWVIFNLPPWNIQPLLGEYLPERLRRLPPRPTSGWGAFMLYAGLDESVVPQDMPLHHQVVLREPLAEGNSMFISISPAWDSARAPAGQRAVTISTHTELSFWWRLYQEDRPAYEALKEQYADRLLSAASVILPGFRQAVSLVLPGTPVTFQRFTRRAWGWVGGFPQTSLFSALGPRLTPEMWMVGDSIFPGQSVPAVALGSLRVAQALLGEVQPFRNRSIFPLGEVPFQGCDR